MKMSKELLNEYEMGKILEDMGYSNIVDEDRVIDSTAVAEGAIEEGYIQCERDEQFFYIKG